MSRIFIIGCVLIFLQLPVFVDQYAIRLEGHLSESRRQIAAFSEAASVGGKTLDQYISKFSEQTDGDFQAQGTLMQRAVERNQFLARACTALREAKPFFRPIVFIQYVDADVLSDAWKSFAPGFSLTLNVALFGFIGWVFGWLVVLVFRGALSSSKTLERGFGAFDFLNF